MWLKNRHAGSSPRDTWETNGYTVGCVIPKIDKVIYLISRKAQSSTIKPVSPSVFVTDSAVVMVRIVLPILTIWDQQQMDRYQRRS